VKYTGDDLNLSIWDEDVGSDDKVGECIIKLSALVGPTDGVDEWFEIQHKGKKAGTVNLQTKYTDFAKQDQKKAAAAGAAVGATAAAAMAPQ